MKFVNLAIAKSLIFLLIYLKETNSFSTKSKTSTLTQTSSKFQAKSKSKSEIGNGIFGSFMMFSKKHKAKKYDPYLQSKPPVLAVPVQNSHPKNSNESPLQRNALNSPEHALNPLDKLGQGAETLLNKVLGDKGTTDLDQNKMGLEPILWNGWLKYFKYAEPRGPKSPTAFYKNNEYYQQIKFHYTNNTNFLEKDQHGQYIYISKPTLFYATLFNHSLNIASDRQHNYRTIYDVLNLQYVNPVIESSEFGGGIKDIGNFNEGFCFKVFVTYEKPVTWVFCTETAEDKKNLMEKIKKIRILQQRRDGLVLTQDHIEEPKSLAQKLLEGTGPTLGKEENSLGIRFDPTKNNITDGYWIIIQDWTDCNLKCGGGNSTLQRMCVPPKQGGKPCEGEAILVRPCNVFPCEGPSSLNKTNKTNEVYLSTKVEVLPFSTVPQRYDVKINNI